MAHIPKRVIRDAQLYAKGIVPEQGKYAAFRSAMISLKHSYNKAKIRAVEYGFIT
jgi:hypothetical protein